VFASSERAERLVNMLADSGLQVSQRPYRLRHQIGQQVVLGPFNRLSDAVARLRQLQQRGEYDDAHLVDGAAVDPTQ
jgi:SPOR domain